MHLIIWTFICLILVSFFTCFQIQEGERGCYWWACKSLVDLDYGIRERQRGVNKVSLSQKIEFITNTYLASDWGLRLLSCWPLLWQGCP